MIRSSHSLLVDKSDSDYNYKILRSVRQIGQTGDIDFLLSFGGGGAWLLVRNSPCLGVSVAVQIEVCFVSVFLRCVVVDMEGGLDLDVVFFFFGCPHPRRGTK